MAENTQNNKSKLFREKNLERLESPEKLNDYLRVTSPGVWMVLVTVIVLLAGVCVWGFIGKIEATTQAAVITENGVSKCLVPRQALEGVLEYRTVKVDGEAKEEDIGVITYDKIHYYEKAGNVHYVSETNGSYSSFGGSLTGATFSKKAALFSGIMFGPMGMATATLMSYKPAQQKPPETHFELTSETKRIDERNVLLNFYSDERNQYIDIELPQEIYNFLQTHLPEKKYEIVSEVEKHAAVNKAVSGQKKLDVPEAKVALPATDKLSIDNFKEKVEKLKIMKEAGLLSDEEFRDEKSKLLSMI